MKNKENIIIGMFLIIFGLVLGLNTLGITNITFYFKGWWTLFIIIPCLLGLIKDKDKTSNLIGLIVGILLLLSANGLFDFEIIFKLLIPIIIIAFGISLVLKNTDKLPTNKNKEEGYFSTFSSQNIDLSNEVFKGTTLNAIFGGIKLDLRNTTIKEDTVIDATSVFGSIDIYVPENVKIKVKSNSLFGGVSNNKKNTEEGKYTIYINTTCMFGGVEIKWQQLRNQ